MRSRTLLALSLPLSFVLSLMVPGSALAAATESRVIGTTVQGRPITAFRLGDPNAAVKVVVLAAMHGNERGPMRIANNLIQGRQIHGVDMWVVPAFNPDGIAVNQRQNANGVDLNRNFPGNWGRATGPYNSGPAPASEPETRAFIAFLDEVNPTYLISFHQPLRGIGRAGAKPAAFPRRLARGLGLPLKSFNCTGVCHGTMTSWFNATHTGTAVTVEYGRALSRRQANRTGPSGLIRAVGAWR